MRATDAITAQCFRDTLLAEAAITAIVSDRIFWERVEEGVPLPYVTMHQITGGDENTAQTDYVDACWKIIGHTPDLVVALALTNAIYTALKGKTPVSNANASGYATIEEETPVFDSYQVQNTTFNMVGGMYRIRLQIL
jgi:hypothetical protein